MNIFNHRRISTRLQQDPLSRRIWNDPYLDWSVMLAFTVVLSVGIVFLGYSVYARVHSSLAAPLSSTELTDKSALDVEMLSKVLGDFNARSVENAKVIRGEGIPGNPSM